MDAAIDTSWQGWEDLTPLLRLASFYDTQPCEIVGPRYNQDFQLLVVQAGGGVAEIGRETFDIARGDVLFYSPNVRHTLHSSPDSPLRLMGLLFLFHQGDAGRIDTTLPYAQTDPYAFPAGPPRCPLHPPPPARVSIPAGSALRSSCESLVLSFIASPTGRSMEKRGLLLLVFDAWHEAILGSPGSQQSPQAPALYRHAITQAQEAILQDLTHPPTMAQLAHATGIHPDYFTRLFKRQTGQSVQGFVTHHRLLHARRLLIEGRLTVGDISRAVGYDDAYYFSRLFRQQFGVAPSVFRKEHSWP